MTQEGRSFIWITADWKTEKRWVMGSSCNIPLRRAVLAAVLINLFKHRKDGARWCRIKSSEDHKWMAEKLQNVFMTAEDQTVKWQVKWHVEKSNRWTEHSDLINEAMDSQQEQKDVAGRTSWDYSRKLPENVGIVHSSSQKANKMLATISRKD